MLVPALVSLAITLGLVMAGPIYFKRMTSRSVGAERSEYEKQIDALAREAIELLDSSSQFVSKKQIESVSSQIEAAKNEIGTEKQKLKDTEAKLGEAQKTVDLKETHHQQVKATKASDEELLVNLKATYESLSEQAAGLEKDIAESMRHLETIMAEVEMTSDQKQVLTNLNEGLTEASSRLRDLLMEYETVNTRLETLKGQHADLEGEYTRLVEQQLGG